LVCHLADVPISHRRVDGRAKPELFGISDSRADSGHVVDRYNNTVVRADLLDFGIDLLDHGPVFLTGLKCGLAKRPAIPPFNGTSMFE